MESVTQRAAANWLLLLASIREASIRRQGVESSDIATHVYVDDIVVLGTDAEDSLPSATSPATFPTGHGVAEHRQGENISPLYFALASRALAEMEERGRLAPLNNDDVDVIQPFE